MLTDVQARRIQPGDKPHSDGTIPGLYLFPSPKKGAGKWILRFVSPLTRKRRDLGLGRYPEVGLQAARKAAFLAREMIAGGHDPLEAKRAEKQARRIETSTPSFEAAARRVFEELRPGFGNQKHAEQWIGTLERFVFPAIGQLKVSDLRAPHFADSLRPIWLELPETASRVRQRCDAVMKWCAAYGYVVGSPVDIAVKLLPRQPTKRERVDHHPALPWRDVPRFVQIVLRSGVPTVGKQALEFLLLTAARSGEVRGMTWAEIDWARQVWVVPPERMKAKVAHRVPLSSSTMKLLMERRGATNNVHLVFGSQRGQSLSDMTLTKILRDAKVASDVKDRAATAHGFRSSFRDWASENGYARDLAERALAHTVRNATEAAYHRTDLLELRRKMMEQWTVFALGLDVSTDEQRGVG